MYSLMLGVFKAYTPKEDSLIFLSDYLFFKLLHVWQSSPEPQQWAAEEEGGTLLLNTLGELKKALSLVPGSVTY